jgi:hypothetical protein
MGWWDVSFLQLWFKHTTSAVATVLGFWFLAWVVKLAVGAGSWVARVIGILEEFVLLGTLIWLKIELGYDLWRRRPWDGGTKILVLA